MKMLQATYLRHQKIFMDYFGINSAEDLPAI
jgi:hypothetical protein